MKKMKFWRVVLCLVALVCSGEVVAQSLSSDFPAVDQEQRTPLVPMKEIISTYRQWKNGQTSPKIRREKINQYYLCKGTSGIAPLASQKGTPMWCSLLQIDDKGKLQPVWRVAEWLDESTGKTNPKEWEELLKRWGAVLCVDSETGDTIEALPFSFPNGEYEMVAGLFPYMGFTAARRYKKIKFEAGKQIPCYNLTYYSSYARYAQTYPFQRETWSDWDDPEKMFLAYQLLGHDLNIYMAQHHAPKVNVDETYFAEVGKDGRMTLHNLLPIESPQVKAIVPFLQTFFQQVPPYALGHIYLADGRTLPGHFLRIYGLKGQWRIAWPEGFKVKK